MDKNNKEKLWSRGFFLIWQGQLVSTLGDSAYSIALGFWVLQVTGSTALMGTLMAVSALPGILISPFAGVLIDRINKKALLILMDILRGTSMVLIAVAAYNNAIAIWMVFAAGILLSICGAMFRPGVNSSIPDLVPKSKLSNANSLLSIASTGASMIGSILGGFLFQTLGESLLFLFNGLSYFFSGGSLSFVKLPQRKNENRQDFFGEMRAGFRFMWSRKGLRYLLITAALINFFSYISIVLFPPIPDNLVSWSRPVRYCYGMFYGRSHGRFFVVFGNNNSFTPQNIYLYYFDYYIECMSGYRCESTYIWHNDNFSPCRRLL